MASTASGVIEQLDCIVSSGDMTELRDVTRQLRDVLAEMRAHEEHRLRAMFDAITRLEVLAARMEK